MDVKSQAELDIIIAADWWAREILRSDKSLDNIEQKLFDAVLYYQRLTRTPIEVPAQIPKPPHIPADLILSDSRYDIPTERYSNVKTIKSPSLGIPTIDIDFFNQSDKD
jgi:hypothetical protein